MINHRIKICNKETFAIYHRARGIKTAICDMIHGFFIFDLSTKSNTTSLSMRSIRKGVNLHKTFPLAKRHRTLSMVGRIGKEFIARMSSNTSVNQSPTITSKLSNVIDSKDIDKSCLWLYWKRSRRWYIWPTHQEQQSNLKILKDNLSTSCACSDNYSTGLRCKTLIYSNLL